jgi:hypothetical protein
VGIRRATWGWAGLSQRGVPKWGWMWLSGDRYGNGYSDGAQRAGLVQRGMVVAEKGRCGKVQMVEIRRGWMWLNGDGYGNMGMGELSADGCREVRIAVGRWRWLWLHANGSD